MRLPLRPHPDWPCPAAQRLEVEVSFARPGALELRYVLTGSLGDLRLPAPAASARADELWRSTCFEAFLRGPGGEGYFEFNFAPSTRWAAYAFTGYRSGMTPLDIPAPRIEARADGDVFELSASIELDRLAQPTDGPWRMGLSAILEDASGRQSYWALAHPPGKPDFHHAAGFAYEPPPAERA